MKTPPISQIILHEDPHILICHKPPGLPVQSKKINTPDLESSLLTYLISKGEPPYLAVIHRLDQPVEGILVFAKNKAAAKDLNAQVQNGSMEKYYLAAVSGIPTKKESRLENELIKDANTNTSRVTKQKTPQSKKAILEIPRIKRSRGLFSSRDPSSDRPSSPDPCPDGIRRPSSAGGYQVQSSGRKRKRNGSTSRCAHIN